MKTSLSPVGAAKNAEKQLRAKLRQANKEGKALKQAEALWAAVFEECPAALGIVNLGDGRLQDANARFAALTGYTPKELADLTVPALVPADAPNPVEAFQNAARDGSPTLELSVPIQNKQGETRPAVWSFQALRKGSEPRAIIALTPTGDWSLKEYELNRHASSLQERITTLEGENAGHIEQKERLLHRVGELVEQGNQLKFDAIKLRQMQQELTSELRHLKDHAGLLAPIQEQPAAVPQPEAFASADDSHGAPLTVPELAPVPAPVAAVATTLAGSPNEQLSRHIAALREMAQRIESEIGMPRTAA